MSHVASYNSVFYSSYIRAVIKRHFAVIVVEFVQNLFIYLFTSTSNGFYPVEVVLQ
jgi:hypothetical protein